MDADDPYHGAISETTGTLPLTYPAAFGAELRRACSPPYEAPVVVYVNGALMAGAWFLLPLPLQDQLFTLHGALAFPIVLVTWMFSDVPATNVLGSDATRALAALDDPRAVRRLLYAKNAVLWLMAAPLCALIALGIGFTQNDWVSTIVTVVGILVIPVGSLGIAAWLGILFPYHSLPVATRWEHRRPIGRMIVRWLTLAVIPYGLVPAITVLLAAPALIGWAVITGDWQRRIPYSDLGFVVAVTVSISAAAFFFGHAVSLRLVHRRHDRLAAYLSDPDLG